MIYLLGLLAKSGHGKTTVAQHLAENYDAQIRSLAGPMKRAVQKVFGFKDEQLWGSQAEKEAVDARYGFSVRWLLQRLGTEGLRDEFGDDVHLRALVNGLRKEERARPAHLPPRLYVVDDVRFPNDARFISEGGPDYCGAVLKIVCSDAPVSSHGGHPSEIGVEAVREQDVATTIVSSREQGLAHLLATVDAILRRNGKLAILAPALPAK